jgi:phage baseplate assembly protein W
MADRYIFYPFRFGAQGVALTADPDRHLRDKVEAVLFTAPGERVNNPNFGVGLNRAVFESLDDLTISALEFRISYGLDRDLGNEIQVNQLSLTVDSPDGQLILSLTFQRLTDRQPRNLEIVL